MPNNKQAIKRVRQNDEARQRNKVIRSSMRTAIKRVLRADSPEKAKELLPQAMKRVDKAAKTHVIHANTAARIKSRLAKKTLEPSGAAAGQ